MSSDGFIPTKDLTLQKECDPGLTGSYDCRSGSTGVFKLHFFGKCMEKSQESEEVMEQESIDQKKAMFWNELCGTSMAKALRINGRSAEDLRRFDRAYFEFYPYSRGMWRPQWQRARMFWRLASVTERSASI